MTKRQLTAIATRLAQDLFTNGQGVHADRLVLWRDRDNANLGGYAERVVRDRILDAFASQTSKK